MLPPFGGQADRAGGKGFRHLLKPNRWETRLTIKWAGYKLIPKNTRGLLQCLWQLSAASRKEDRVWFAHNICEFSKPPCNTSTTTPPPPPCSLLLTVRRTGFAGEIAGEALPGTLKVTERSHAFRERGRLYIILLVHTLLLIIQRHLVSLWGWRGRKGEEREMGGGRETQRKRQRQRDKERYRDRQGQREIGGDVGVHKRENLHRQRDPKSIWLPTRFFQHRWYNAQRCDGIGGKVQEISLPFPQHPDQDCCKIIKTSFHNRGFKAISSANMEQV